MTPEHLHHDPTDDDVHDVHALWDEAAREFIRASRTCRRERTPVDTGTRMYGCALWVAPPDMTLVPETPDRDRLRLAVARLDAVAEERAALATWLRDEAASWTIEAEHDTASALTRIADLLTGAHDAPHAAPWRQTPADAPTTSPRQ